MIQRVVEPAMQGAVWARETVLSGVSRLCLEAIDLWGRTRAAARGALRMPRISLSGLLPSRTWFRRRGARAATAAPAVAPARILGLALDIALAGGAIFVVILMHREVYSQMQVRPAYRMRLEELRLAFRPAWAPQETVTVGVPVDAELDRQARGCDPGLVGAVARRLEQEPWVRRVAGIRRVCPDRLEARVELRRPQACILRGTRGVFIDADGVRLPELRSGLMPAAGCYEIAGVDGPTPEVGTIWNHAGVRAALDVIKSLETYRVDRVLLVSRIDVSNLGGKRDARDSEILCWTASGVPVAWGRPSTTTLYGENPVEMKMKLLALALEAFPGLRGLERVDLRFDRVVVRPRPEWRVLASAAMPGAPAGSVPR